MTEQKNTPLSDLLATIERFSKSTDDDVVGYGLAVALDNFRKQSGPYDAAPYMLEALLAISAASSGCHPHYADQIGGNDLGLCRAAIAKATGE